MKDKEIKLKNHIISLDTKTLQNVLSERFGVSIDSLEKVLSGDKKVAKQLGEYGRIGRFASKYAPKVTQSILDGIEGTVAINEATAKVLQAAGKGDTKIRKDGSKTLLANQRYNHDKAEISQDYDAARKLEATRHDYAVTYIELRSYYDEYFLSIDEDARLVEQGYRPELKQVHEDQRMFEKEMDHLLQYGNQGHFELMPGRDYLETEFREVGGAKDTIKGFLSSVKSALGF